jgi:NAD(P)H-nitrite reductase large subunit
MEYVIIGNGAAGVRAVEAIRKHDPDGGITLLDAEPHRCYYRMMLPDYISGLKQREALFLVSEGFYEENRVDFRPGTVVSAVDTAAREVRLADGASVPYDRLLVASGARPRPFTVPGSGLRGEVALRTLDQADAIIELAGSAKKAVALGGGLLGVELARSFNELGLETAYLIREDRFWPQMLDRTGSAMIERRLEEKGIDLRKQEGIEELLGEAGRLKAVKTTGGAVIEADILGAAIGVTLNLEFLEGSGVETRAGVLVDGRMRSSVEGVYAAGDVAQAYDPVHGEHRVATSFVNARRTGEVAGANMAGGGEEVEGTIASNLITIYGIPVAGMGMNQAEGAGYEVLTGDYPKGDVYKRCVFKDGAMVGATLVGDVRDARAMERLIAARADLSGIKDELLEEGFDLKAAAREILGE